MTLACTSTSWEVYVDEISHFLVDRIICRLSEVNKETMIIYFKGNETNNSSCVIIYKFSIEYTFNIGYKKVTILQSNIIPFRFLIKMTFIKDYFRRLIYCVIQQQIS